MPTARKTRGRPRTGAAVPAAERMRQYRARQKTAGLKSLASWVPRVASQAANPFSSHQVLDARSLALHCLIAQKIMADPSLIAIARRNLTAWRRRKIGAKPHYLAEWQRILARSWPQIAGL